MQAEPLDLPGIVKITPVRFGDDRGYFSEIFKEHWFRDMVADVDFVQENQSLSRDRGVVRGLHFQTPPFAQGKLLRCVAGEIFDVAVDLRSGSTTFGKWTSAILDADKGEQLWIPAGFAHGFCTLTENVIVCYRVTAPYSPDHDKGVAWDDVDIAIDWPDVANRESLSGKDREQPRLRDLPDYFGGDT